MSGKDYSTFTSADGSDEPSMEPEAPGALATSSDDGNNQLEVMTTSEETYQTADADDDNASAAVDAVDGSCSSGASFSERLKCLDARTGAFFKSKSLVAKYMLQYTGFIYMFIRSVSLFFLFQVVIFTGFMIFGTSLNFMVSFAYVFATVNRNMFFTGGFLFLVPYIMSVYFWFTVQLLRSEVIQLVSTSKIRRATRNYGIVDLCAGVCAWISFFTIIIMLFLVLVSGTRVVMVLLLVCSLLVLISFSILFRSFFCYSKSLVVVVGAALLSMFISVSGRYLRIWLNEICYSFFLCSCVLLVLYFLVNSFPCHTFTLLKAIFNFEVSEKDFGRPVFKNKVFEVIFSVVVSIASLSFFISVVAFSALPSWSRYNLVVYIIIGIVWVAHMTMMWVARIAVFIRTKGDAGFKWVVKSGGNNLIPINDPAQESEGNSLLNRDRKPTFKEKVVNLLKFHLKSMRKDNYVFSSIVAYCLTILVAVGVGLVFSTSSEVPSSNVTKSDVSLLVEKLNVRSAQQERVSVCSTDAFNFSWLDYALMSRISYNKSSLDFSLIMDRFLKRGFDIKIYDTTLHYCVLHHNVTNVTVVSFRGTSSALDVIHDVKILIESTLPNFASPFITLPLLTKDWLTEDFAFTGSRAWPGGTLALVDLGMKVVGDLVDLYGEDNVVVTGHSLGGALANIVATHFNLTNYGVSPPGSEFGRHLYNFTISQITKYVNAMVPQRDPVTTLGSFQGTVVHIPCRESSSLGCHSLDSTICMISVICNDMYLNASCAPYWKEWSNYPEEL